MKEITVGFADDHRLFRMGFAGILKGFPHINLLIVAENGPDLLEQLKHSSIPDVILLDLEMPAIDGIKVSKILKAQYPEVKTIILTGHDDEGLIRKILQEGVNAYLHKDAHEDEVKRAIMEVAEKGRFSSTNSWKPDKLKAIVPANLTSAEFEPEPLTPGEIEIVKLICQGLKNEQIAEELNKGLRTIHNQRLALRRKINAKTTADIISYAIKNNIIAGASFYKF